MPFSRWHLVELTEDDGPSLAWAAVDAVLLSCLTDPDGSTTYRLHRVDWESVADLDLASVIEAADDGSPILEAEAVALLEGERPDGAARSLCRPSGDPIGSREPKNRRRGLHTGSLILGLALGLILGGGAVSVLSQPIAPGRFELIEGMMDGGIVFRDTATGAVWFTYMLGGEARWIRMVPPAPTGWWHFPETFNEEEFDALLKDMNEESKQRQAESKSEGRSR
ncbi:MAG: hypothetical protein IPM29_20415 [Planctomycetes bacterium]|nr:hypothetical protein [Planctomycetota bacterium]